MQIIRLRRAQSSVSSIRWIDIVLAWRSAVVAGTMPIPTLHSTSRHTASKLRSWTRNLRRRPIRSALSERKRCSALVRSSPTKSKSSTSAKGIRPTVGNGGDDLVTQPLLQIDVHLRMGGEEIAEWLRQEFGQRIGVGQQANLSLDALGILRQLGVHALCLLQ